MYESIGGLGRIVPPDWTHLAKYPARGLRALAVAPGFVSEVLELPPYRKQYNQQSEGACVGFSASWLSSINNQVSRLGMRDTHFLYDAWELWELSKEQDEFADTQRGDSNGTSLRAAFDILKARGHKVVKRNGRINPITGSWDSSLWFPEHGIREFRWAESVDDIRAGFLPENRMPGVFGIDWYPEYDEPVTKSKGFIHEYWIGTRTHLLDQQRPRGGHAICCYGADDKRQAFKLVNTWGLQKYSGGRLVSGYPLVWFPYETAWKYGLRNLGEYVIVTDIR